MTNQKLVGFLFNIYLQKNYRNIGHFVGGILPYYLYPLTEKMSIPKMTKSRMFPSLSIHDNVMFPTEKPASTLKNNKAVYSKTKDCAVFSNISQLKSLS